MAVGGPIYFFQHDETEFVRRPRKSLSLIESLEEEASLTKQDSAKSKLEKETVDESKTRPGTTTGWDSKESRISHYNHELVSRIEEDARLFLQDGTSLSSATPSLHKFLPLLKQAILTFDKIDPSPVQKVTLHEKYQMLKAQSGDLFEELTRTLELFSKENYVISPEMVPGESREVFLSNFYKLTADTEVEYREWQRGSPPHNTHTTTGKLNSQVSELTQSFDGSRSGKSRYSRRQKTLFSGGETDGGTSSRSNEGTIYGGIKSARRESARRRNMLSDQSDIIEDLYLENNLQSEAGSRMGKDRSGMRRKEMENLYEMQPHNTTINFSLINQNCAAKGWIINQGDGELKDRSLVKYLLERLQKCKMNMLAEVKKVNQQKYPSLLKYYSEFESEPYKIRRPFSWSGRHKVGFVTEVPQDTSSQFIFAFPDGSTTLYYPNGLICCVLSNCPILKEQDLTRTVNIFHHLQADFIVASFNPSGVGSCWYNHKSPAFLSTILGGCIYNEEGVPCKSWSWNNIDTDDFLLTINDFLTLFFTSSGEVYLHLQLSEECVFINVKTGKIPTDDTVQSPVLMSNVAFRSVTAQTILNAPKTRNRRRLRQKRISSTRVTDDSENEELLYPHKHSIADPTDRYLINTSKKIVRTVDEFLQSLRQELSLGKTSQRNSRAVSAASKASKGASDSESTLLKLPAGFKTISGGCKKKTCVTINLNSSPFLIFPERRDPKKKSWKVRSSSACSRIKSPRKRLTRTCPVAMRLFMATNEEMMCKCDWRVMPQITDLEFDRVISECSKQLVVVSVYSSRHPEATPCDAMMDEISYGINYSRSQPCVQAVQDKYRLIRYDMASNTLLKNRHNVVPGMFLIYSRGRLVFADLVFNGYGNAKKDFMKQVYKCGKLSEQEKFLPDDFKFTGMRSWDEADETVRQILTMQFGQTSGWIAPKLTPLTRKEDVSLIGW